MATVRPFRALRPRPEAAAAVSAVPYDVVSTAEARALAAANPLSFLHVSRAEIDLPDGTDPYSEPVYARAAESFEKLKRAAPLTSESEPSLYAYRLRRDGHEQTGVAGCCSIDEYDADLIRKHERTRPDKEDDRTRHMLRLRAQTGPVFLAHRDRPEIDRIVAEAKRETPLYDFAAPDGVSHTVWRLGSQGGSRLAAAFAQVPQLYIADGHHRAASASRARRKLQADASSHNGQEAYNFFLAVVFPAGQLRILPYNRVVKDLGARSPETFLDELRRLLPVRDVANGSPAHKGEVRVYLAGHWHGIELPPPTGDGAIEALDADRLQRRVLEPLLGIRDVRTDKRIDFVGGVRGTEELERLVNSGRSAVAFSMYPVSLAELMDISDANEIMPPKSTWFEPKLRDGLLIHEI
ncbi:MAG TPA: DUF1015 family protein [Thermoanaerobaculia bacterium]|nr:DUF1015 family protein [Thermoanaerobaculia bacterium]